jgi:hypothetical protein
VIFLFSANLPDVYCPNPGSSINAQMLGSFPKATSNYLLTTFSGLNMALQATLMTGLKSSVMILGLGRNLVGPFSHSLADTVSAILQATLSYFRKFEKFIPDREYPDVDASARGSNGPVQVGYFNYVSRASKEFIASCINVGIPFNPDFNGPAGTIGVSRVSIGFSFRVCTCTNY